MGIGGGIRYITSPGIGGIEGGVDFGDRAEAVPAGVAWCVLIPGIIVQGHHPAVVDAAVAGTVGVGGGTVVTVYEDIFRR